MMLVRGEFLTVYLLPFTFNLFYKEVLYSFRQTTE
jgi:hypothetical protein